MQSLTTVADPLCHFEDTKMKIKACYWRK